MLGLLTSFSIPLPYKLLAGVALAGGLAIGGFAYGNHVGNLTGENAVKAQALAEAQAAIAAQQKAAELKQTALDEMSKTVTDANARAAASDNQATQLQSRVDAYTKSLPALSGCVLSATDVSGLLKLPAVRSVSKRAKHSAAPAAAK